MYRYTKCRPCLRTQQHRHFLNSDCYDDLLLQASCSGNAKQSEDVLSLLSANWPGRRDQIQQLMCFIAEGKASMPPVLIYGGPSTGKTAVLR